MISVIIPWKDRPELRQTLADNLAAFEKIPELELLIVNMGGEQQHLLALLDATDCKHLSVKVVHIFTEFFNKSFALNWGINSATQDTVFVLDADVLLSHSALSELYHHVSDTDFANIKSVTESNPQHSHDFHTLCQTRTVLTLPIGQNQHTEILVNQSSLTNHLRTAPGLIMARKQHLLAIEGFDSKMTYWGWEDLDLIVRLKAKLNLQQLLAGQATHLTHDDSSRNLGALNRAQSDHQNFSYCLDKYASGQFLGSLHQDTCNQFEQYVSVHHHSK
ncbi:MAG: glycosyltransferase family 2 protein [Gammaproteobacteria bacterium]|nr:glycosyltransferase family 2 protein [Gammaproteobacteria bacterium]MBU2057683.1 glycosyltransferase family 2 protein [Gammaproteobacteria bacterium]MBU2176384.1 glycosyltransferase family 2 protein [Gammaproteobacteria bacterium]MBU2246680.1 glycosyltransferase family 2 protein [Gammaproteobacteria bacterium]MBU2343554.1 glycosyltransferase family 2 protein [Gammaproteobacteria bacterium]